MTISGTHKAHQAFMQSGKPSVVHEESKTKKKPKEDMVAVNRRRQVEESIENKADITNPDNWWCE